MSVKRLITLLGVLTGQAIGQTAVVSVRPSAAIVNGTFTVDIAVDGAKDLFAYQFDLTFPAGSVTSGSVTEGPFLSSSGATYFVAGTADTGAVRFVANALAGPISGANGSGVLARASFAANAGGVIPIGITNVLLLDSNLATIPATTSAASVTATVTPPLTFTPARLTFEYQIGQAQPGTQTIAIDSDRSFSFTTDTGAAWLTASPAIGSAPSTLRAGINPAGLPAGVYVANVNIRAPGAGVFQIPVTLTVYDPSKLITLVDSLTLQAVQGSGPSTQLLYVTASSRAVPFTASAASSDNWLSVNPASANTPANLTITLNPANLGPGVYQGSIMLISAAVPGGPRTIPVTFTVSPAAPVITAASVVNAASQANGPVCPGEIVTILSPGAGALAPTRMWFDGLSAPVIPAEGGTVRAVTPYAIADRSATQVQIESQGVRSSPVSLAVAPACPGLFTRNGSGRGQVMALNEDGGVNSPSNPAKPGSMVVFFATGAGVMDPPGEDGKLATAPYGKPVLPVTVAIGGEPAELPYVGAAPGLIAGMLQVNAKVPDSVATGDAVPVSLSIGGVSSQAGVTLAVR